MKTKLEMAHDYAMKHIQEGWDINYNVLVVDAWAYADAMQAEADKRQKEEQDKLEQNERNHHDALVEIGLEEWQPDWSQAPEWAVAFTVDTHGDSMWWSEQPTRTSLSWFVDDYIVWRCDAAPSFGYTGDWRNSLRKRPQ